jgi:putative peptidoglycan lipid II flippase
VAISLAVLPTLSRFSAAGDASGFRGTLGQSLRLVLVLIIPATLGLLVLAEPLIALLFQHGKFTADDTYWTAWALRLYLVGLVFATVDWPLNYAFYARQNTRTPALVGVLSVGVYLAVALTLIKPLGMLGLVLADSAKHISHALTMSALTWRSAGGLADMKLGTAVSKALAASLVMAGLMALTLRIVDPLAALRFGDGLFGQFVVVAATAGVGLVAYLSLAATLRIPEVGVIQDLVRERWRGSVP